MAYKPQLQALPWVFVQRSTHKQQEGSLQLHAEKKALAALHSRSTAELTVSINFNACMDCHELFKSSSLLLACRIQLRQPRMAHTFTNGRKLNQTRLNLTELNETKTKSKTRIN